MKSPRQKLVPSCICVSKALTRDRRPSAALLERANAIEAMQTLEFPNHVVRLQIEPKLRRRVERPREAHGHLPPSPRFAHRP